MRNIGVSFLVVIPMVIKRLILYVDGGRTGIDIVIALNKTTLYMGIEF